MPSGAVWWSRENPTGGSVICTCTKKCGSLLIQGRFFQREHNFWPSTADPPMRAGTQRKEAADEEYNHMVLGGWVPWTVGEAERVGWDKKWNSLKSRIQISSWRRSEQLTLRNIWKKNWWQRNQEDTDGNSSSFQLESRSDRHFNCLVHAGLSTLGHSAERHTLLFLEGPNTQRFHCKGYLLKTFKTFSNQKKPAFASRLMVQSHDSGHKEGWVGSIPGSVLLWPWVSYSFFICEMGITLHRVVVKTKWGNEYTVFST